MSMFTVARVRNFLNHDGSKGTAKVVITAPNLDARGVALELKKKPRFKDTPAEDLMKDIEIVGDEESLTPSDVARVGAMTEKNTRVAPAPAPTVK